MTLTKTASTTIPGRRLRQVSWILPLLIWVIIVAISSETYIVNLVVDDALYYPTVARSIAAGQGSSYDGITQTNGYHPLWGWLQVPVAAAVGGLDPLTYLWFTKLLMSAIVILALVVWERVTRLATGSVYASSVVVVLLGSYWWSIYTLYSGMETPLVILLMGVSILLVQHLRSAKPTITLCLALGISMSLTFLARLDVVFFLGALGLFAILNLKSNLKMALVWIAPLILLPLPYLWWNLTSFGSVVPVSGLRKTVSGIDMEVQWAIFSGFWTDKLGKLMQLIRPTGAIVLLIAIIAGLVVGRRVLWERLRRMGVLWALPIGAILHYAYTSIFMTEADVSWYQYSEYLTAFLFMGIAADSIAAWLREHVRSTAVQWLPFGMVLLGVLAILILYAPRKLPNPGSLQAYRTAVYARDQMGVTSESRFGMGDSGIFRFVSGFKTITFNGLAGDQELLQLARRNNLAEIIQRYKLDYVVNFYALDEAENIPRRYVVFTSEPYMRDEPVRMLIMDSDYWSKGDN